MTGDTALIATPSQTVGPFFHHGLVPHADPMADRFPGGERIRLLVRVTDGDSQPVSDALVEVWQRGVFGRMPTREDGTCEFETVRPGTIPDERVESQAPHISVCLFARGLLRQLHTRIYFAGDPALAEDAALGTVPEERRGTLLASPDPTRPGHWVFDVHLQGERETVFFDV
ncbi:MAG: protocatechuate 3,4-dioxygenase subunit alpha [Luteitalea sp.]|nr:protocatechuate 3,4-dioxygenase subunit alpha [Luteitalea sp.]